MGQTTSSHSMPQGRGLKVRLAMLAATTAFLTASPCAFSQDDDLANIGISSSSQVLLSSDIKSALLEANSAKMDNQVTATKIAATSAATTLQANDLNQSAEEIAASMADPTKVVEAEEASEKDSSGILSSLFSSDDDNVKASDIISEPNINSRSLGSIFETEEKPHALPEHPLVTTPSSVTNAPTTATITSAPAASTPPAMPSAESSFTEDYNSHNALIDAIAGKAADANESGADVLADSLSSLTEVPGASSLAPTTIAKVDNAPKTLDEAPVGAVNASTPQPPEPLPVTPPALADHDKSESFSNAFQPTGNVSNTVRKETHELKKNFDQIRINENQKAYDNAVEKALTSPSKDTSAAEMLAAHAANQTKAKEQSKTDNTQTPALAPTDSSLGTPNNNNSSSPLGTGALDNSTPKTDANGPSASAADIVSAHPSMDDKNESKIATEIKEKLSDNSNSASPSVTALADATNKDATEKPTGRLSNNTNNAIAASSAFDALAQNHQQDTVIKPDHSGSVGDLLKVEKAADRTDSKSDAMKHVNYNNALAGVTLRVMSPIAPPFLSFQDSLNSPVGIDVELLAELQRRTGFKLENNLIEILNPADIIAVGANGGTDIMIGGANVNSDRKDMFDHTKTYLTSGLSLVVRGDSGIKNEKDLSGRVVGIQDSSNSQMLSKLIPGAIARNMHTPFMCLYGVSRGTVDATVIDSEVANFYKLSILNHNINIIPINSVARSSVAFLLKKDSPHNKYLQAAFSAMIDEGVVDNIVMKYYKDKLL